MSLSGSLDFLNLGELLNLLGTNGSSGVLHVKSSHSSDPGLVYLDKGNPINAVNGSFTGLDAVFSLFGWTAGHFEFVEEDVTCEKAITKRWPYGPEHRMRTIANLHKAGISKTSSSPQPENNTDWGQPGGCLQQCRHAGAG